MKKIIVNNSVDNLSKMKFSYKIDNEELTINEVVKFIHELRPILHNKKRFVIYKVKSVCVENGKIYFNSYETDGLQLTTVFNYPNEKNQTGISSGDYVISYGILKYYNPQGKKEKYYLNTLSDLNINKINDTEIEKIFENMKINKMASEINHYKLDVNETIATDINEKDKTTNNIDININKDSYQNKIKCNVDIENKNVIIKDNVKEHNKKRNTK